MCRKIFVTILFALFSGLLLVSQDAISSGQEQSTNLTQTLPPQELLWQALQPIVKNLPLAFSNYQQELQAQIKLLQDNNDSLATNNNSLAISNKSLIDNNQQLTSKNESLKTSLLQSQMQVEISADNLQRLQRDLKSSTNSIIQAQLQAKILEVHIGALKLTCYGMGTIILGASGYETGHLLKWW